MTDTEVTLKSGGSGGNNYNGADMIYYIWADVPGLQKFGSYLSIGGNDGNFVYLGFKPIVLWIKSYIKQTQHHGVSSQMKLISLIHSTIHSMLTTMVKKENVVIMLTLAPLMLIS